MLTGLDGGREKEGVVKLEKEEDKKERGRKQLREESKEGTRSEKNRGRDATRQVAGLAEIFRSLRARGNSQFYNRRFEMVRLYFFSFALSLGSSMMCCSSTTARQGPDIDKDPFVSTEMLSLSLARNAQTQLSKGIGSSDGRGQLGEDVEGETTAMDELDQSDRRPPKNDWSESFISVYCREKGGSLFSLWNPLFATCRTLNRLESMYSLCESIDN